MKRPYSSISVNNAPNAQPDVVFAGDPPTSFYALVLAIDEARGRTQQDDQIHLSLDAAWVGWYRSINVLAPPPLNGVAVQSGCRLLELILTVPGYQQLNHYLQTQTGHQLEESSWWMITPTRYNFRAAVRMEQFLPVHGSVDPSTVGRPASLHRELYVLPRLIVPRSLFAQQLFAMRDR